MKSSLYLSHFLFSFEKYFFTDFAKILAWTDKYANTEEAMAFHLSCIPYFGYATLYPQRAHDGPIALLESLKGATYQHLVNMIFKEQIGQNMEVYVDDILVKRRAIGQHMDDLEKMFCDPRK
ncbi:uncharacterized protein LOC120109001, partial [Phoenix dactylifera]|uniref:Uncharacterized protein LOC120109001 n=1 Tax=Phoenix dactylifera TaxID=42345 RepID=A0A8B9A5X3_PHODC